MWRVPTTSRRKERALEPTISFGASKKTEFRVPPVIQFGPGTLGNLGAEAAKLGKHALLVTDRNIRAAGHVDVALKSLEAAGVKATNFDGVEHEPEDTYVASALKVLRDSGCDIAVAVGGGSAIDTAKATAAMATNPGEITDYMGANKLVNQALPIIAAPTTAGTGSEVTPNTIINDTRNNVKIPNVAIIDPTLTLTCPAEVIAPTGIDALTHAIEAYVSKKATPATDPLALEAIRLIGKYLRRSWANRDDTEARQQCMYAATLAGMAFSNASVNLVHGMSRPIGALFHVPHGISNAMLLPAVCEFSLIGAPERHAKVAEAMGAQTDFMTALEAAKEGVEAVRSLCEDVHIPTVTSWGIEPEKFRAAMEKMATDAIASGSPANNPRAASKEEIIAIYESIL